MLLQADKQVSPRCAKNHSSLVTASASTLKENTNSLIDIVIPICFTMVIFGIMMGTVWHFCRVKKRSSKSQVAPTVEASPCFENQVPTSCLHQPLVCVKQPSVEISCQESIIEPEEFISSQKESVFNVVQFENDQKTQATPYNVPVSFF